MKTETEVLQPKSVDEYLDSVVIGIKFRPNFSLEDKLGSITDQILYDKDSYFNETFFTKAGQQPGLRDRILMNDETRDSLTINSGNILLEYNLPEPGDMKSLKEVMGAFHNQIIEKVLTTHEISQYVRIGLVKRYLFPIAGLAKSFLNHSIGKTIEGVNDINLRFSKRYPVEEALIKKEVSDYINVIYNVIKKEDKEELFISVDYQWYFDPPIESISELKSKFKHFSESAEKYNRSAFPKWVETNYGSIQG